MSREHRYGHRSDSFRYRNPHQCPGACDPLCAMPDPFLFIVGLIAIACVILFPIRLWRRHRHRYGDEENPAD